MPTHPSRELLQVPYLSHASVPAQTVDIFLPERKDNQPPPRLIIFIHGGAWRTGDNTELHPLARKLISSPDARTAVALINYRLSPHSSKLAPSTSAETAFHPAHVEDVHAALRYLLIERPEAAEKKHGREYDNERVVLGGHSVGAWLTAAVMLDPPACRATAPPADADASPPPPTHPPLQPASLRTQIETYILLDGIYDIDTLLDEYPDYNGFVGQAFDAPHGRPATVPSHGRYHQASLTSWVLADVYASRGPVPPATAANAASRQNTLPRIRIAHSRDDELLTLAQPTLAHKYLSRLLDEQRAEPSRGAADDDKAPRSSDIEVDYESITGGHFQLLESQALVDYLLKSLDE